MITRLPPTEFTYARYNAMILLWEAIRGEEGYIEALLRLNVVGYCDSIVCEIRPRLDEFAVMFYDDEEHYQSWAHVPMDVFNAFLEKQL